MTELTSDESAIYEWQMWVHDFGAEGQKRLKQSRALISRVGGLGGSLAYALTAAGIGKLVLAHAGNTQPGDLNRQITQTHDWVGKPRIECSRRRLLELNPRVEIEAVAENVSEANADDLVRRVDIVFDCAPRFEERFAMNAACVRQGKPMVEAAMFDLEGQITTILPGKTPCLACLYPEFPSEWKRQFPVFGAVSGVAGNLAAMEGIKLLAGMGETMAGKLLTYNLRHMEFRTVTIRRRPDCPICGSIRPEAAGSQRSRVLQ